MILIKKTYILLLILLISGVHIFSVQNNIRDGTNKKEKSSVEKKNTGSQKQQKNNAKNNKQQDDNLDPETQLKLKKQRYKRYLDKGFSLLKENKKQKAVEQFEKIIFVFRNPVYHFPKLKNVFKPNTNVSLVQEITIRAQEHFKKNYLKKSLLLYRFLVKYNENKANIIQDYNKVYNKYKEVLDTINKGLEEEENKNPIEAREKYKLAVKALNISDEGKLFEAVNKKLNKLNNHLINERRPAEIKNAKQLLKNKDFDKAEKAVTMAIRIKDSPELQKLLKNIRYSRLGERVKQLFEQAEKNYIAKKFDKALELMQTAKQEFANNELVIKDANEKIALYSKHKKAWEYKTKGLEYFEDKKWKLALENFRNYLKKWEKPDKEIEKKMKTCQIKLMTIAKKEEFNRKYSTAIRLFNTKQYEQSKNAFTLLKENYPFKHEEINNYIKKIENILFKQKRMALLRDFNVSFTKAVNLFNAKKYYPAKALFQHISKKYPFKEKEVKEYIERIDKIIDKQKRVTRIRNDAQRFFDLGMNKFDKAVNDRKEKIKDRIALLEDAKINFFNARNIYEELKADRDVARCDNMIARCNQKAKDIKKLENDRLRKLVTKLIKDGKTYFDQQKFKQAIITFNKVLEIVPENEEASRYLKSAREALLVRSESKLTPEHRHYVYYISFEKRGKKFYYQAEDIYKEEKKVTKKADDLYQKSLQQWRLILVWFPNNETAFEYIKRIYKRIDPKGYITFLNDYVNKIRQYLKPPNVQKERAYALLQKIRKDDTAFFRRKGLQRLLEKAKPQRLVKTLTPKQRNRIIGFYQQATAEFANKNDNKAIALTNQAIRINPFAKSAIMNKVRILQRQAINRKRFGTGGGTQATPKPTVTYKQATRFYYMALAAYQKKNYKKAVALCNSALRVLPNYNQARQLKSIAEGKMQ